jgi:hypothetical protein
LTRLRTTALPTFLLTVTPTRHSPAAPATVGGARRANSK